MHRRSPCGPRLAAVPESAPQPLWWWGLVAWRALACWLPQFNRGQTGRNCAVTVMTTVSAIVMTAIPVETTPMCMRIRDGQRDEECKHKQAHW